MEPKRITSSDAEKIVEHLTGEKPLYISKLTNGMFNKVYKVVTKGDDLIVRISDEANKINTFLKEQWCATAAREKGIPTPDVLEVGNQLVPYPYMVIKEVPGLAGNHY